MLYRCLNCDHKEARGILPTVTCGIYLFALVGLTGGIFATALRLMRQHLQSASETTRELDASTGFDWWAVLLIPLSMALGLALLLLGALIFNYILELTEWLVYCRRRCPKCRKRRWSWGFTEGFGL